MRRDIQHTHACLMNVRKLARAGERVLAPRDILLALGARRGDLVLDQALLERSGCAAGFFDFLE